VLLPSREPAAGSGGARWRGGVRLQREEGAWLRLGAEGPPRSAPAAMGGARRPGPIWVWMGLSGPWLRRATAVRDEASGVVAMVVMPASTGVLLLRAHAGWW
jgi:hypothetical protein